MSVCSRKNLTANQKRKQIPDEEQKQGDHLQSQCPGAVWEDKLSPAAGPGGLPGDRKEYDDCCRKCYHAVLTDLMRAEWPAGMSKPVAGTSLWLLRSGHTVVHEYRMDLNTILPLSFLPL